MKNNVKIINAFNALAPPQTYRYVRHLTFHTFDWWQIWSRATTHCVMDRGVSRGGARGGTGPPQNMLCPPLCPPNSADWSEYNIYGAGAVRVHLKSHALPLMSYINQAPFEVEHTYSLSGSLPIISRIRCHWIRVLSISQCSTTLDAVNFTAQTVEARFHRLQTTSLFIVSIQL